MAGKKLINEAKNVKRLEGPTLIRYSETTRYLWGDEESHQVSDWYYGAGERIASFMFSLRPGNYFKYSKVWKTHYDQQRLYYVLQGGLVIHDPQSGEVAVANEGEAIYWHGHKWHFGYNFGQREALILEGCVPPLTEPEIITSAREPGLDKIVNGRYELLGKWPSELFNAQQTAARNGGLLTIRRENCLRLIAGTKTPTLVSLFVSTDMMTVGFVELGVDKMADAETHPGDEALVCTRGRLNVYLPETFEWFELHPKDGMFIPEGTPHQYCSMSDQPVEFFFAVAPRYR
jgi:mannose-6-phosphate isomerase-like protein (cupin superfamily)